MPRMSDYCLYNDCLDEAYEGYESAEVPCMMDIAEDTPATYEYASVGLSDFYPNGYEPMEAPF